jgi:tRNA dimethylallyltransferase
MRRVSLPAEHDSMSLKRKTLVLVGPTGSGKTAISLLIASRLNAEIISADSRQIYRYLDIGTAKPTLSERASSPHHFVDVLEPDQPFNSGEFGKQGREVIAEIFSRGRIPMIVGGSGLYLRSLIDGFFNGPGADRTLRQELYNRLHAVGPERLLEELRTVDPHAASRMLPGNTRRIVRALEIIALTGKPISEMQKDKIVINFHPVFAGLEWNRKDLYHRIDERVDRMIENGLVDEVRMLKRKGYSTEMNALQTTGYVEIFSFLEGKITFEEMVQLIKRNSRRYAKRQITWFRPDRRIKWFSMEDGRDMNMVAESILSYFLGAKVE